MTIAIPADKVEPHLRELFEAASKVMPNAHAQYSKHPVASALRFKGNETIYAGVNVENAAYPLGMCAEANAIGSGVTEQGGEVKIEDIVIVGPKDALCTPCGGCRQRIREFADAATRIHVFNRNGDLLKSYTMDELLPDSFGPDNL